MPNYNILSMKSVANNLNNLTYTDYYYRLQGIARSVFKWSGLPDHIDEKWIEQILYDTGSCLFFEDPTRGLMVARCTQSGQLNYYEEPTELTPYGIGYTGESMQNGVDCVLIRNNDMYIPTKHTIQLYALRLAEVTRSIDVNINAQKTPIVITCSDKQKNSMVHVFKQASGNEPVIYGDKNLDIDSVKVLKTEAPVVFPQLQLQKNNIWNECMSFLGVNNANMDKRERLVAGEVNANNDQIQISAQVMLKARERACELINNLFGLNVSVELRVQPSEVVSVSEGGEGDD